MRQLVATAVALLLALPAQGETTRFALLVANNEGGSDLPTLRYAVRDAQRLGDVLSQFGGFGPERVTLLDNRPASDVLAALKRLDDQVRGVTASGGQAMVLFYYSGHAKDGLLRLGETRLDMRLLKSLLEAQSATVKVAFLDSCGSGSMTREKGGSLAPPFVIAVDDSLTARGQVIITSSSADEASQESDEIQGSFFTHYLATGLRGDADGNADGRVTLGEAYQYAYARTVAATSTTRSGAQHPTYQYDLRGAGDVVLSAFAGQEAMVTFPADLMGRYFLIDAERQLIVAEIDKSQGAARRLALKGGSYVIKKRLDDHLLMQRVSVAPKGSVIVDESQMQVVSFADDYAKGTPILQSEIDHGRIRLSLSLAAGGQLVLQSPTSMASDLFPPIGFGSLELRLHNLLRRNLLVAADVGFGTRPDTLKLSDTLTYQLRYDQLQLGAAIVYELPLGPVTLGAGPRLATLVMHRAFGAEAPLRDQWYVTMCPGVEGLVGVSLLNWFHLELMVRGHYLLYTVDANRSFGYVEGLASAWIDF